MMTVEDLLGAFALAYDTWLDPEVGRENPLPEYAALIRRAVSAENDTLRELAKALAYCLQNMCLECPMCAPYDTSIGGAPECRPTDRLRAARTLSKAGYDVALRVSPYIPELIDIKRLTAQNVEKCLIEFLRINPFIKRWLEESGYNTTRYTCKSGGYRHLPLDKKIELVKPFRDLFELTVCEDVQEHYDYWTKNLNANPDDCCNLRRPKC